MAWFLFDIVNAMNERIKELAEQANFIKKRHNGDEWRWGYIDPELSAKLELFAELIIKECLTQCEQIRDDAFTQKKSEFLTDAGKMLYEGVYGGATNCGFAIQQHFGVNDES